MRIRITIASMALGMISLFSRAQDANLQKVVALYNAKEYAQCIAFINGLRTHGQLPPLILGYDAHCRLGLKDYQAARGEYTQALKASPVSAAWLIGRAKCEIAMGSLRDAEYDFKLAGAIDPALTAKFTADSAKDLEAARSQAAAETPAQLLAALGQAIAANQPNDDQPLRIAEKLMRARNAARHEDLEEYTREYARLQTAAEADPKNVDKRVALAKFLLVPTVTRGAAIPGVDAAAAIPCGDANNARAKEALAAAARIAPENPGLVQQEILYFHAINDLTDMMACVNHAIEAGGATLDTCLLNLEYHTEQADRAANEAIRLRTPIFTSSEHREGNKLVTVRVRHDPSPADLARADTLDAQSTQLRIRAHNPLRTLMDRLKTAADPASKAQYQLALAHEYRWRGKYAAAIKAAQEALTASPYDLDTLNFLIDLTPMVGQKQLGNHYQDFLNNIINPSAGRTLDQVWPLLRQGQSDAAMKVVDQAQKIEPSSVQAAACRFAIAGHMANLKEMSAAAKGVVVMEEARLRLGGRTLAAKAATPLSADDAGLSVYVRVHLAETLERAGHADEAARIFRGAGVTVNRVPPAEWGNVIKSTALTTDDRDRGTTLSALAQIAWRQCAYKDLADKKYDQAANDCAELVRCGNTGKDTFNIGLAVYRALGWKPLAGRVPENWRAMFENSAAPGGNRPLLEAQVAAIDVRLAQIEREIRQGLGPYELAQHLKERDTLQARRQFILNTMKQR